MNSNWPQQDPLATMTSYAEDKPIIPFLKEETFVVSEDAEEWFHSSRQHDSYNLNNMQHNNFLSSPDYNSICSSNQHQDIYTSSFANVSSEDAYCQRQIDFSNPGDIFYFERSQQQQQQQLQANPCDYNNPGTITADPNEINYHQETAYQIVADSSTSSYLTPTERSNY